MISFFANDKMLKEKRKKELPGSLCSQETMQGLIHKVSRFGYGEVCGILRNF